MNREESYAFSAPRELGSPPRSVAGVSVGLLLILRQVASFFLPEFIVADCK